MVSYLCLAGAMMIVGAYVGFSKLLVAVFPVFLLAWLRFGIAAVAMSTWLKRGVDEPPLDVKVWDFSLDLDRRPLLRMRVASRREQSPARSTPASPQTSQVVALRSSARSTAILRARPPPATTIPPSGYARCHTSR